jgi:hypothetical protein
MFLRPFVSCSLGEEWIRDVFSRVDAIHMLRGAALRQDLTRTRAFLHGVGFEAFATFSLR